MLYNPYSNKAFVDWCTDNPANIYSNGYGESILLDFPYEIEAQLLDTIPNAVNLLNLVDGFERGMRAPTQFIPNAKLYSSNRKVFPSTIQDARERLARGETQQEVADSLGIHRVTLNRRLRGK